MRFSHADTDKISRFFRYGRLPTIEEKVTANKIGPRLLCRIGLSFSENRHVLKISVYSSSYCKTSFPNAEHCFSLISKHDLQRVGVCFSFTVYCRITDWQVYILYISRSRLFSIRVVVRKQAKETFTAKDKIL